MRTNPMGTRRTRKARAADVMRQLKEGPGSLNHRSPFTPGGDEGEKARVVLHRNYLLWVSTWILPELQDLIPELRQHLTASSTNLDNSRHG